MRSFFVISVRIPSFSTNLMSISLQWFSPSNKLKFGELSPSNIKLRLVKLGTKVLKCKPSGFKLISSFVFLQLLVGSNFNQFSQTWYQSLSESFLLPMNYNLMKYRLSARSYIVRSC